MTAYVLMSVASLLISGGFVYTGTAFAGTVQLSDMIDHAADAGQGAGVKDWKQWPAVGKAELRWFVFDVYTSELRSESGRYQENQRPVDQNLVLKITYRRSIDAEDLLEATQEQWLHLGYAQTDIEQWSKVLAEIYPSVSEGDELSFVIHNQQGGFFFRKRTQADWQSLGEIKEPLFSNAFISIWLSPETEYPRLRQQLIGGV